MNLKTLISLIFLLNIYLSNAQNSSVETLSLNNGTIDNQFEFVIRKSNRYQEYKVVKTNWLYALKAHTLDSLNAVKEQLDNSKQIIDNQEKEIEVLKTNLSDTNSNLDKIKLEKDSMSLFGMQMTKTGSNILLWSLIGALLAFLLLFIYKYKNSNVITRNARLTLAETEEEFEAHRKRALEREQNVMRRLQDEINKQKETRK